MALVADGGMSSMEDLRAQDSGVLEVARVEGIDVTAKLKLAQEEIEIELGRRVRPEGNYTASQMVATPMVRKWHLMRSLEMIYRDAYFSQLNDRFGGRWRAYESEARWAMRRVLESGIPMAAYPVRRPEGVNVAVTAGSREATTYWIAATVVDSAGHESAMCETTALHATAGHGLKVELKGAPAVAAGWNVYIGTSEKRMRRQNLAPVEIDAAWVMPAGGLVEGPAAPGEQEADFYVEPQRLLRR